jgi:hypothetical protein
VSDAPSPPPEPKPTDDEEVAPTPFDGPYFLPVVLLGLALWFGYDGWINEDPKMQQHGTFNRVGAVLLALGALLTWIRALRMRSKGVRGES